ncbi:MAG TPA: hypothetical protein VL523_20050 [Terriglobia bacterium]|nr:hypothetical protein [Terriglobia bacterium]
MAVPRNHRTLTRLAVAIAVLLAVPLLTRPWFLHWGATKGEIQGQWPGDELSPPGAGNATRAITIYASAAQVWPWIVQIGQDRAGFYSYTWLENLLRCDMHTTQRIVPGWQSLQAGDTVWMCDRARFDGRGRTIVAELIPGRALILAAPGDAEALAKAGRAPNGTWGFVLDPIDEHQTRLIMQTRGGENRGVLGSLWSWFVFDPAHFIMERGMMIGIKERAERSAAATRQAGQPAAHNTTG